MWWWQAILASLLIAISASESLNENQQNEFQFLNDSLTEVKNSLNILRQELQLSRQRSSFQIYGNNDRAIAPHGKHDEHLNCVFGCDRPSVSCVEAMGRFGSKNFAHPLKIPNSDLPPFYAFCYNQRGRYTIIQRRHDGSENFYRSLREYKEGFGDVFGEYWLGLERIHEITKQGRHKLWIMLKDYDGNEAHAYYQHFEISDVNSLYKLNVSGYSGNAGDSLSDAFGYQFQAYNSFYPHNFLNCPEVLLGAWWYPECPGRSNLNGPYQSYANRDSYMTTLHWFDWRNYQSLRYVHMAILRVDEI